MLGLALLITLELAPVATPDCPSPAELDVRFSNLLLQLHPGLRLEVLTKLVGEPSHGRFYPKPDGTREAIFEPRVHQGSREVGAGLRCLFAKDDSLLSCDVLAGPFHTQFVERDVLAKLTPGRGAGAIFQALCSPGRIDLSDSGNWQALYFLKTGGMYGSQAVTLTFDSMGQLIKVDTGH
jgi:hypothetical protein